MSASQSKYEGADNISYMILFKNGVNHRVDGILGCVVSDHVPNTPSCFHHSKIHLKVLQKKKWQSQIFYMQLHTWRMSLSFLLHLEKKKKKSKITPEKKIFSLWFCWRRNLKERNLPTGKFYCLWKYKNCLCVCMEEKKSFHSFFFFFFHILFFHSLVFRQ